MTTRMTKASKKRRIVVSKKSASARVKATKSATKMVRAKKSVNATKLTRSGGK